MSVLVKAPAIRGDGYLRSRLAHVMDLVLRRQAGLRDWSMAIGVVALGQFTAAGVDLEWGWFGALLGTALAVLFCWGFVFPRLQPQGAIKLEQVLLLVAWAATTMLVYASGGADSPYVFFFALSMIFVAAFDEPGPRALVQIALGSACALAPVAYDTAAAVDGGFLAAVSLALLVWWGACALVAVKRRSSVRAELNARRLANVDSLTGAANLRALEDFTSGRGGYALIVVDAEFAARGDSEGTSAMLELVESMRQASGPEDQVARIGGTWFAVVLPNAGAKAAERWRTRFNERVEMLNAGATADVRVTVTTGASICEDRCELRTMIDAAERGMQRAADASSAIRAGAGPAERARRLRDKLGREAAPSRNTESVDPATGPLVALLAAVACGAAIYATDGASSPLLSLVILAVAYFAVFGSAGESAFATVLTIAAAAIGVFAADSVSDVVAGRVFTIGVAVAVMAYNLQMLSRRQTDAERRAARLSTTDPLTGLPNRRAFERDLGRAVEAEDDTHPSRAERFDGHVAVVALDLPDHRALAARVGQREGELIVLELAAALRAVLEGEGTVYRIGSDAFAVIIRAHHAHRVELIAARCDEAVRGIAANDRLFKRSMPFETAVGGAIWQPGMSGVDLAIAAVSNESLDYVPVPQGEDVYAAIIGA